MCVCCTVSEMLGCAYNIKIGVKCVDCPVFLFFFFKNANLPQVSKALGDETVVRGVVLVGKEDDRKHHNQQSKAEDGAPDRRSCWSGRGLFVSRRRVGGLWTWLRFLLCLDPG